MIPTLATVKAMTAALHDAYLVCLLRRLMKRHFFGLLPLSARITSGYLLLNLHIIEVDGGWPELMSFQS